MNTVTQTHPIRLGPPWFADTAHAGLYRYLDADFVNHFRQDIERRRFDQEQFGDWIDEDRRGGDAPVLRLTVHRSFHIFCCEVSCDRPGQPALDPQRVRSAGFVIRRLVKAGEQAWMLEDGEAVGWHHATSPGRDPDLHRRLRASGVLRKHGDDPSYTGEETHPLHVLFTRDETGRSHTLLFGFVPLGGSYFLRRGEPPPFDPDSQTNTESAVAALLPWPFGYRGGARGWNDEAGRPISDGRPTPAMFELLRTLVTRFHVGEHGIEDNAPLQTLLERWNWQPLDGKWYGTSAGELTAQSASSLGGYLKACFARDDNPLVGWLATQEERFDAGHTLGWLPAIDGSASITRSLSIEPADAEELRELLGQRYRDQTLKTVREIPLPKFTQGEDDRYRIVPFVRTTDERGCERIQWSDDTAHSIAFRVAAPFDPEAARPSLIQMPSLRDLKSGLARGASMLTPPDTFNLMDALRLKKGASEDVVPETKPSGGLGLQWICSFSLPVITLVAMILLMIMVIVLNLLFFWLPWVRICLPLPKIK
ncbi:hypothetical protein [Halomonas sp. BM-2019]|uniref:hypothetical protein n=1 Tax=Halomonas sp. BM-2019 TaxID=2811227 RepID=UPI001B3C29C2|nr:MAG: hypothetical protein J5F18_09790 [Halomonas sp. BM-2019]